MEIIRCYSCGANLKNNTKCDYCGSVNALTTEIPIVPLKIENKNLNLPTYNKESENKNLDLPTCNKQDIFVPLIALLILVTIIVVCLGLSELSNT